MQGTYGALDRNDVKYYAHVIGYWQMSTDATVQKHYNSNSTVTSTAVAGQRVDGPTGIVVDVDAFSWGLANYVDPKNLDTVRKHTLVTGLTTTEARGDVRKILEDGAGEREDGDRVLYAGTG